MAKVPVSAPAVAHAESRPTSDPVLPRSRTSSFAAAGVTPLSTAAGGPRLRAASTSASAAAAPAPSPSTATIGTLSIASTPPPASSAPISSDGSTWSASLPPIAAPTAIPPSATPMIAV